MKRLSNKKYQLEKWLSVGALIFGYLLLAMATWAGLGLLLDK
jgi:hypothetical protein